MRGGGKEQKKVSGRDKKYALGTEDLGMSLVCLKDLLTVRRQSTMEMF